MYPHRINLHGPWECQPLTYTVQHSDGSIEEVEGQLPRPCKVTLPGRWGDAGIKRFAGRVRYHRRFHWPGQLDYYERLWLTFAAADYFAAVWLNGEELGRHAGAFTPFEFDITPRVQLRNDLIVEVDLPGVPDAARDRQRMLRASRHCPPDSGGLWGGVGVEVRRDAFLRGVHAWATFEADTPTLHVTGQAMCDPARKLELYLLLDDATIHYSTLEADPAGRAFHVSVQQPDAERWQPHGHGLPRLYALRIELVDGASKCDQVERGIGFRHILGDAASGVLSVNGREIGLRLAGADANLQVVDLDGPERFPVVCTEADRAGKLLSINLPLQGGYAEDEAFRHDAALQVRDIVTALRHHPSILGWTIHRDSLPHDAALDEALRAAVGQVACPMPTPM